MKAIVQVYKCNVINAPVSGRKQSHTISIHWRVVYSHLARANQTVPYCTLYLTSQSKLNQLISPHSTKCTGLVYICNCNVQKVEKSNVDYSCREGQLYMKEGHEKCSIFS